MTLCQAAAVALAREQATYKPTSCRRSETSVDVGARAAETTDDRGRFDDESR